MTARLASTLASAFLLAAPAARAEASWSSLLSLAESVQAICESFDSADCTYFATYQASPSGADLAAFLVPVTGAEREKLLADALFTVFAYHELEGADLAEAVKRTLASLDDLPNGELVTVSRATPGYHALPKANLIVKDSCNVAGPSDMVYLTSNRIHGVLAIASDVCD